MDTIKLGKGGRCAIFGQFFVLFVMVGVGYFANHKKMVTSAVNTGLGSLVMKLTCPALLFVTISQNEIDSSSLTAFFLIVLAQYVASVISGKILCVYCRKRGWEEKYMAMLEVTSATSNNGFIGLPVALMFLGEFGGLCMSAGFFGIHLYLWTYAVRVLQGNTGEKMTVKEIMQKLMNPNCVMVFAGLVFSLMGWTPLLPAFVMDAMSMLGNMSTPLSLIYIGAMAGNEGILQLIHKRKAVETALVRMIFFPLVTIGLVYFLPIDAVVKTVCVVSMACPCAAIMPMVVEQYGKLGAEESSDITLLTTVFAMGALPLSLWLCAFLF